MFLFVLEMKVGLFFIIKEKITQQNLTETEYLTKKRHQDTKLQVFEPSPVPSPLKAEREGDSRSNQVTL